MAGIKCKFIALLLLLWAAPGSTEAAELLVEGVYNGKNLYVQNPTTKAGFCISAFVVNLQAKQAPKATAFEIDLSHLKPGHKVEVKIIHSDDCEPKVMNVSVLQPTVDFRFTQMNVDNEHISWAAVGEKKQGQYFVEVKRESAWSMLNAVACKGQPAEAVYKVKIFHQAGLNRYRIRYMEATGKAYYSTEVNFEAQAVEKCFYPERVSDYLYFSCSVPVKYEIKDASRKTMFTGTGEKVDCRNLPSGLYYIIFEGRTEKFLKK